VRSRASVKVLTLYRPGPAIKANNWPHKLVNASTRNVRRKKSQMRGKGGREIRAREERVGNLKGDQIIDLENEKKITGASLGQKTHKKIKKKEESIRKRPR